MLTYQIHCTELRKGEALKWTKEHSNRIRRLKENFVIAPTLKPPNHTQSRIFIVDSSLIRIEWVRETSDFNLVRRCKESW